MKIKLSPAMLKVIKEVQHFALWLTTEKDNYVSKVEKQATKHKKLTFVFKIKSNPCFQLYVNKDFYGTFIWNGTEWHVTRV